MHQKGEIKTMEEQRRYRPSAIRPRVNLPRPPSHVSTLHIAATQEYMHIDRLADGSKLDETNSTVRTIYTCRLRSSLPVGPDRWDRSCRGCLIDYPTLIPVGATTFQVDCLAILNISQAQGGSVLDTAACGVQHQKLQSESEYNNVTYLRTFFPYW